MRYAGWWTRNNIVKCPGRQPMSMITGGGGSSSSSSVTKKWCKFRDVCLNNMHSLRFAEYWGPVFICRPYRAGRMPSWLLFLRKEWRVRNEWQSSQIECLPTKDPGSGQVPKQTNKLCAILVYLVIFLGFWDGLLSDTSTYRTPVNMHRYSS